MLSVQNTLQSYILYEENAVIVEEIESKEHWYTSQAHPTRFFTETLIEQGHGSVETVAQGALYKIDAMV